VTSTFWLPHDDENETLPLAFFTLMVKVAGLLPVTVAEPGET
jgi:hypothetical protein